MITYENIPVAKIKNITTNSINHSIKMNRNILNKNRIILFDDDTIELENYKYKIIKKIGLGSFSNVFEGNIEYKNQINNIETINSIDISYNSNHNNQLSSLALKFYKDKTSYISSGVNEINILEELKDINIENNIIKCFDYFNLNSHICIVFKKYDMDLYKYYNSYLEKKVKITKPNFNYVLKSIALGLSFLKTKKIINTDLKPENIFINIDQSISMGNKSLYPFKNVVISDFSSSLRMEEPISHYNITSLWYRAPETYFQLKKLDFIDIWSFGCILYEVWYSEPLFSITYDNNIKHIDKDNLLLQNNHILKIGYMSKEFIESNYIKKSLIVQQRFFHSHKQSKYYKKKFEAIPYSEIIKKILIWEPTKRITPEDILKIVS